MTELEVVAARRDRVSSGAIGSNAPAPDAGPCTPVDCIISISEALRIALHAFVEARRAGRALA